MSAEADDSLNSFTLVDLCNSCSVAVMSTFIIEVYSSDEYALNTKNAAKELSVVTISCFVQPVELEFNISRFLYKPCPFLCEDWFVVLLPAP